MSLGSIIHYNKTTSDSWGWLPAWFKSEKFDKNLVDNIKKFQSNHGITADGMCGPATYRRIWTHRASQIPLLEPPPTKFKNTIIYNNNFFSIKWPKVIHWFDNNGLKLNSDSFSDQSRNPQRKISAFINHWDVCLNSVSCVRVLNNRRVSVHFCIDNDGTIYQLMDLQNIGWHASSRSVNNNSVGVEISNAYYLKYQQYYIESGFEPRPIVTNAEIHGKKIEPFLGFYKIQLNALAALWEATSRACGIPLKILKEKTVSEKLLLNKFAGFANHYNTDLNKIDCACLDMDYVFSRAMELRNA